MTWSDLELERGRRVCTGGMQRRTLPAVPQFALCCLAAELARYVDSCSDTSCCQAEVGPLSEEPTKSGKH